MNLSLLKSITYFIVIIGALNWGLLGLFDIDLVALVFGEMSFLTKTIYNFIGLSAILSLLLEFYTCKKNTKCHICTCFHSHCDGCDNAGGTTCLC